MKSISIITLCRNEEANVEDLYERVRDIMAAVGCYRYEHIFIDSDLRDRTVELLKRLAALDRNVKLIVNSRDFGQSKSPMHALSQTRGDAVMGMSADFSRRDASGLKSGPVTPTSREARRSDILSGKQGAPNG